MTRAVVDTNIVVSAFLWGGTPRAILDAARRGALMLFTSAALIAELEDVLSRAKFAKRIADAHACAHRLCTRRHYHPQVQGQGVSHPPAAPQLP